jgi:UDP-N-acetylglucosamine 4,6-dehydratase
MSAFKRKRVLVTGGTGSFGRLAVRRLLAEDVREVRVFSRDEKKQWELMHSVDDDRVTYVLGDVRNLESLRPAVQGIEVVFHAAALKYVPRCEFNVLETVLTNVIGTANLVRACREARVGIVVALSTDKAVLPVNAYGMSKALMERLLINANIDLGGFPTRFVSARYGNVIGSSGSVIPFFQKQIAEGGPVTLTNPEMTRFWITLDQAVDLAFQAAVTGIGGEVFVRRIPSAMMADLAAVLVGDRGIEIKVVGTRPGEKVHEQLVSENEAYRTMESADGYVVLPELPLPHIQAFYGKPEGIVGAYSSNDALMTREELASLLHSVGWLQ